MENKMLKRLLRDRKGVSLAEVVVAMTLVVIITGAAISVVIASIKADAAYQNKYRALTACENAAECLRFSKGVQDKLEEALDAADFKVFVGDIKDAFAMYGIGEPGTPTNVDGYIFKVGDQIVTIAKSESNYVVKYKDDVVYEYKQKTN